MKFAGVTHRGAGGSWMRRRCVLATKRRCLPRGLRQGLEAIYERGEVRGHNAQLLYGARN